MDTKQNSAQLRLDEVHETLERAKTYHQHDGFPARFYVRDVSHLLAENDKLRRMLRDLVTGPHFDPDRYSWTSVHDWLVANDAEFAAERE